MPLERAEIERQNQLSERWECLNPTIRDYLMTQSALRVPTISECLRDKLQDRRLKDLDFITQEPPLRAELAEFVVFKNVMWAIGI